MARAAAASRAGQRAGLYPSGGHFRIEPLATIKPETVAAFEAARTAAEPTAAQYREGVRDFAVHPAYG